MFLCCICKTHTSTHVYDAYLRFGSMILALVKNQNSISKWATYLLQNLTSYFPYINYKNIALLSYNIITTANRYQYFCLWLHCHVLLSESNNYLAPYLGRCATLDSGDAFPIISLQFYLGNLAWANHLIIDRLSSLI